MYWTVVEDAALVTAHRKFKGKKDYSDEKVIVEAVAKLNDRSEDEIRDRFKTFFVKLSKTEEDKIVKASTVGFLVTKKTPGQYARFEKSSKGTYSVREVSDELPGLESIARSNANSRNNSAKKSARASQSPQKTGKKEMLAKIEEHDEDNDARLGKRASLSREIKRPDINTDDSDLSNKLHAFLDRLKSEERKDLELNARMLARFIQHFACNFSCSHDDIIKIMEKQGGDINIDKVRSTFVKSLH